MIVTDWQARHGLSASAYQAAFDELAGSGYRLVKVTGYPAGGQPRFAGIWQRRGGLDWQARHGITADAYQQAITDLAGQKYRPTHVSVFGQGHEARFSAVWEREWGLPWVARHGLTADQYQQLFNSLSADGYRLRCVSGYEIDGEPRFACIWDRYAGPAWQGRHGLDGAGWQREFDALSRQGYRLIQAAGYSVRGTDFYAGVWEQSAGHGWQARHGLPAGSYQAEFDAMVRRGFRLVDVSGFAAGGDAAYTTIWEDATMDQPAADPVIGLVVPFMQKWAVPGLSLAVARNGTPHATRCFGYANMITREIVQPATRFRIASTTKPITSTAIFQLIEQNRLHLTDKVFGAGAVLGTTFGTQPYGAHIADITIQNLLEHAAGGWQNDGNDPMFQMTGLNQEQLISWTLDHQPLANVPGTVFAYSNFGYCVLGRVIEAVSGMSYRDYVRRFVLAPSGVRDMDIAGNTAPERQLGEAMYVGKDFEPDLNVPYGVPVHRMDSHGGWIGTASDLVQFLLHVDGFAAPADILGAASVTAMTTPSAANAGYARGWNVNNVGTRWHDGLLPGSQSIMVRTAQQHEWAAICNTGKPFINLGLELDQLMWKVDGAV